jgi:Uncharacterized protein conserved in bacteria
MGIGMWHDLLAAVALVLIIEGILPFLSPEVSRRVSAQVTKLDDHVLRIGGLSSMIVGVVLLYLVR